MKKTPFRSRFGMEASPILLDYSGSLKNDKIMIREDLWGSKVHVLMLAKQEIISDEDAKKIIKSLGKAEEDLMNGRFRLDEGLEDIHLNVENYVITDLGLDYGGRMHTARSRNDQVLTDTKLHLRSELLGMEDEVLRLQKTLLDLAEKNADAVMPGYTHLQHAQPVTMGFCFTSHVSALCRDSERLRNAYLHVNTCPLGACALAGTSFPIDRGFTAKLLGFDGIHEHSLDAVGSRDFITETLASAAILMSDLSRLAEDLILWSSYEFGFIEFSDSFSTGSSIMPQKKNPDIAELVRGRCGRAYGSLIQVLTVLKGLPSGYNRDLQEDRELLWNTLHTIKSSLQALNEGLKDIRVNRERMREITCSNFSSATELANYLVREKGLAFRKAYEVVGTVVKELIRDGRDFGDIEGVAGILRKSGIEISPRELCILDPLKVVEGYDSVGSSSPGEVKRMIKGFRDTVKKRGGDLGARRKRVDSAWKLTEKRVKEL